MIWKLWKKPKSNIENIWKNIWKKDMLNCELIGKIQRKVS